MPTALPSCPPDWKLTLVAEAPQIRHPSVVACAPDGRVFVAEDPMDISTPSADMALGRIICFHPDGTTTLFADKLHAVFGLQYLDGKLYVLHNPKFSRFTDSNGIGTDRIELIESTNPNPWALNWNDHVPANFRLAMDGFLYVAVGDKGIYGAVGRDGKRVDLQGGGILRLRPDGTELEVFSTGVRNILDVALNEEDELFTYDNTDEQQWMSRLTHMVDAGFYGYPYDFIPQRPYTLWMMADYGGGAATGVLSYNEDALPPEYHGNLFLADFGKRQLLRVRIVREGATYKAVTREDFFSNVPNNFKPVGIALAPDGLSLYICDWAHPDTKEKIEVGRLWKLSYTGKSQAAPKPNWFLSAGAGSTITNTTAELLAGLAHPSQSVRLAAQRRLMDRARSMPNAPGASQVFESLRDLLANRAAPRTARWHALWALDSIDGGLKARATILAATQDSEASVRRQAIRELGFRQVLEATPLLHAQLTNNDASIRFQAATALGRLAQPASINPLLGALNEKDLFVRYAAFTALNRIGRNDGSNWQAITRGLENTSSSIRDGTFFALRETFDPSLVEAVANIARDTTKPPQIREPALQLAASLHHQKAEWKGEWWAYHPVNAPPAPKNVSWAATETILSLLRELLEDREAGIRRAAIHGIAEAKDLRATAKLRTLFRNEAEVEVKRELLNALGTLKDPSAIELIQPLLEKPDANLALLGEAIDAAAQIGGEKIAAALFNLVNSANLDGDVLLKAIDALVLLKTPLGHEAVSRYARHPDAAIRERALSSVIRVGGESARSQILKLLEDSNMAIRRSALAAISQTKDRSVLPQLLKAYENPETRDEAIAALTAVPDIRGLDAYLVGLSTKSPQLRQRSRSAIKLLRDELLPLIEEKLPSISAETTAELQEIYRDHKKANAGRLFAVSAKKPGPEDYMAFALKNRGDPESGRKIFSNPEGLACQKCHAVRGQGGNVGPDLSTIGAQGSRQSLAESVLWPSKAVREGYQQYIVETKGDEIISGLLKAETPDELVIQDSEARLHRISKAQMKTRKASELSLMPEGLHEGLSLEQFTDLVAFLETLRSAP